MPPALPLVNPMGSSGPASPPSANPGMEADGDSKVREAVHLLEMALPSFQMGSDKHKAVLDALKAVSKPFPASAEVPGVQMTQLMALVQKARQSAMMQAAMRQQQAQGGASPPGPAPPPGPAQAPHPQLSVP